MYILIPLCLSCAGLLLWLENRKKYVPTVILKGMASLCFVILGLLCSPGTQMAKLIVWGLIFGCIADVMLNLRWIVREKGKLVFLLGILIFLGGHIFYLAAILRICSVRLVCVLLGAVLTGLLMIWIFRQITAEKAFKIFGVVYIGAIVIMNTVAVGNLITSPSAFTGIFAGGAVLFLISDIVLILNTFGSESKMSLRITNLGLYYVGQLMIAISLRYLAF
ncbi:MAG: lysoplasmalogenase [Oscillospiraceae bacterium]|nr:lysoplasmalogenase [Oscillospiraceae bacterium]